MCKLFPERSKQSIINAANYYFSFPLIDGPRNTVITGPCPTAEVNDTYLCESDGNPAPEYAWMKLAGTGPDHVLGDTLTVGDTMEYHNHYQCIATNQVGNETFEDTAEIHFLIGTVIVWTIIISYLIFKYCVL